MAIGTFFETAARQLATARDAAVPIALAAIAALLLGWFVTFLWYRQRIVWLKKMVSRREAEAGNRAALAAAPVGAAGDDGEADEQTEQRADARRALRLAANTSDQAELALRAADPREMDRALASMALALPSIASAFALEPLPFDAGTAADLERGKAYLDAVRPALRAGDIEDARRVAADQVRAATAPRPSVKDRAGRMLGWAGR